MTTILCRPVTLLCLVVPSDINVLDWGRNNLLAVALGPSIFLWNSQDGSVTQLLELTEEGSYITALSWAQKGKYLAVGVNDGSIQVCVCVYERERERGDLNALGSCGMLRKRRRFAPCEATVIVLAASIGIHTP